MLSQSHIQHLVIGASADEKVRDTKRYDPYYGRGKWKGLAEVEYITRNINIGSEVLSVPEEKKEQIGSKTLLDEDNSERVIRRRKILDNVFQKTLSRYTAVYNEKIALILMNNNGKLFDSIMIDRATIHGLMIDDPLSDNSSLTIDQRADFFQLKSSGFFRSDNLPQGVDKDEFLQRQILCLLLSKLLEMLVTSRGSIIFDTQYLEEIHIEFLGQYFVSVTPWDHRVDKLNFAEAYQSSTPQFMEFKGLRSYPAEDEVLRFLNWYFDKWKNKQPCKLADFPTVSSEMKNAVTSNNRSNAIAFVGGAVAGLTSSSIYVYYTATAGTVLGIKIGLFITACTISCAVVALILVACIVSCCTCIHSAGLFSRSHNRQAADTESKPNRSSLPRAVV